VRHFNCVLVIVSKFSWHESNAEAFRHNEMTATKIRANIEAVLAELHRQEHYGEAP
jgi:hypothetical protein